MAELMTIISVYYRSTNRHGWQLWTERPIAKKEFIIECAKEWRARLGPKWHPMQLGYVIHEIPRCGQIRSNYPLKCNDARVKRIE